MATRASATAPVMFRIALRQMIWSKRTILLFLISLLPAAMTLVNFMVSQAVRGVDVPPPADLLQVQSDFFLKILLPLAAILYGGAVTADEVDSGTFVYLWARPVPRWVLVTGRTLAAAVATAGVVSAGILCLGGASMIAGMRIALLAKLPLAVATIFVAAPAYAALFGAFGSWFRRPMVAGLLWALIWENLVGSLPGTIRLFTVTQHSRSLFPYFQENSGFLAFAFEATPAPVAVAVLLVAAAALVALHTVWLRRFELRLQGGED